MSAPSFVEGFELTFLEFAVLAREQAESESKRDLSGRANGSIDPWYGCFLNDELDDYALNFSLPWSKQLLIASALAHSYDRFRLSGLEAPEITDLATDVNSPLNVSKHPDAPTF